MSVPQSSSDLSVRIQPLWVRSLRGWPRRTGAGSPLSRISLSTRFLPTRISLAASRALTFRWLSPRNGLAFSTVRTPCNNSSSLSAVFGPRFPGWPRSASRGPPSLARNAYTARPRDYPGVAHHRQRVGPVRRRTHPSKRLMSLPFYNTLSRPRQEPNPYVSENVAMMVRANELQILIRRAYRAKDYVRCRGLIEELRQAEEWGDVPVHESLDSSVDRLLSRSS